MNPEFDPADAARDTDALRAHDARDEPGRLRWRDWRARWPHAAHSRFVQVGALRWHVQTLGDGPTLLLLHGTGASTHSWAPLLPQLAARFRVVVPDLPGHGFTATPAADRLTLDGMAADVRALLLALELEPDVVAGHSAGAAVLLRMALDGGLPNVRALVGIAPALVPPDAANGALAALVAPIARTGLVAQLAAAVASLAGVRGTLASTGSQISDAQVALYEALAASPAHTGAALGMMAGWRLAPLAADLPRLDRDVTLLLGARDRWVRGDAVRAVAARLPRVHVVEQPGTGHLVHEERPDVAAAVIGDAATRVGIA